MIADVNLFGVFVNGALLTALAALAVLLPLRALLIFGNCYRFVWHAGLFDVALFVVLWGSVSMAVAAWPSFLVVLLG